MVSIRQYQKKTKPIIGLTLLEVMLAVAILLLGVMLAASQYQKTVLNRKIAQIQNSVRLLSTALEQYYYANCSSLLSTYAQTTITTAALTPYVVTPQVIGNAYSTTSGLNAYTYLINTVGDLPVLQISTTFNSNSISSGLLNTLAAALKPTSTNKYVFTWSTAPGNTTLTPAQFSSAISYTNTLSIKLSSPDSASYPNTCFYWQQPVNRCKIITSGNGRCTYQTHP